MKKNFLPKIFLLTLILSLPLFVIDAQMYEIPRQVEFKSIFDLSGPVWKMEAKTFINRKTYPLFRWLSKKKKEKARYPGYGNSPAFYFMKKRIWEANISFDMGLLNKIELSLYNRGDAGDVKNEKEFNAMLDRFDQVLSNWAGEEGTEMKSREFAGKKLKIYQKAWVKNPTAVILSWSYSGKRDNFKAEYIKADFIRYDKDNDPRKWKKNTTLKKTVRKAKSGKLIENVKKEDNGDIFIENIPMVNQGPKGYCAVATAERVFRYYGLDLDQHMFAQMAESSSRAGTNVEEMLKVLKKIGVKCGVRIRTKYRAYKDVRDLIRQIGKYNKFAKKKSFTQVDPQACITIRGNTRFFDVARLFAQLDPEGYRQYRVQKEKSGFKNFKRDIISYINKGIPLPWSVILGIVREDANPLQMTGGHMRLISGYNKKEDKIIYSDSWGAGHEFKTMPFEEAWTITTLLNTFEPRKKK